MHRGRWEMILRQKSRETWLTEGDWHTKFCFFGTIIRRRQNRIQAIKIEDSWISGRRRIEGYFTREFKNLFQSTRPHIPSGFEVLVDKCIIEEESIELIRIPSPKEIKESIWSLHPLKSPRSDSFTRGFYRKYWSIVKDNVIQFVQECFRLRTMSGSTNKTFLVLIPKTQQVTNFDQFRLVSLRNFAYKVVAKILANWLRGVLDKLFHHNKGLLSKDDG